LEIEVRLLFNSKYNFFMLKTLIKHKKITIFLIIILAAAGWWLLQPAKTKSVAKTVLAQVQKGTIVSSVAGTGQIESSNSIDIKSRVAGDVISVKVQTGQAVKAGQVLVALDDTDAKADYLVAKNNLENAKLTQQQSKQNNEQSLDQAKNAVVLAQNSLDESQVNLSKTYDQAFNTIVALFVDLPNIMSGINDIINGSNNIVVQTSGNYLSYYQDALHSYGIAGSKFLNLGSSYTEAKNSYNTLLGEYKTINRNSKPEQISKLIEDSINTAKKISAAVKDLGDLIQQYRDAASANNGTPQSFSANHLASVNSYANTINNDLVNLINMKQSIVSAQQSVDNALQALNQQNQALQTLIDFTNPISENSQAQNLADKEKALADAAETLSYHTITAPFDGIISAINVQAGDSIAAAVVATEIAQTQIAKITLNEVDAAKVKDGQKATLTFDAIDGLSIVGTVSEVDAVGTVSQGVVSYGVKIALDTNDERIKPGMTTTAAIINDVHQNVLTVPRGAVKSSAGANYVLVPAETINDAAAASIGIELKNPAKQQTVIIGLSDDTNTEIISGLNENDWVVVKTITSTNNTAKTSSSGPSNPAAGGGIFSIFGGPR